MHEVSAKTPQALIFYNGHLLDVLGRGFGSVDSVRSAAKAYFEDALRDLVQGNVLTGN